MENNQQTTPEFKPDSNIVWAILSTLSYNSSTILSNGALCNVFQKRCGNVV